jgi:hypothetical protein
MGLVKKAVREKVKVKVLLMSPSGAGKTYSALRLATGMKGKTLFIDTEARRGLYYADEFDYDYIELKEVRPTDEDYEDYKKILPKLAEPFAPENYISLIKYAVDNKYDNLIIDSLTHEWNSKGGILDALNKMVNVKNDMQKWAILTPRHNDFIYAILHSPINVIATVRCKDEYVLETNEKGKNVPRKVGLGAVQRDGMEYEYTVTFMLDQDSHIAVAQKDNTHFFDGIPRMLTEEDGKNLIDWANSGEAVIKKTQNIDSNKIPNNTKDDLSLLISQIETLVNELVLIDKDKTIAILKDYIKKSDGTPTNNYNLIKDIELAKVVLASLESFKASN